MGSQCTKKKNTKKQFGGETNGTVWLVVSIDGDVELTNTLPQCIELILVLNLSDAVRRFRKQSHQSVFTFLDLQQIAGTCASTLRDWIQSGLIEELPQRDNSRGKPRLFSFETAIVAMVLGMLRKRCQPVSVLKAAAEYTYGEMAIFK